MKAVKVEDVVFEPCDEVGNGASLVSLTVNAECGSHRVLLKAKRGSNSSLSNKSFTPKERVVVSANTKIDVSGGKIADGEITGRWENVILEGDLTGYSISGEFYDCVITAKLTGAKLTGGFYDTFISGDLSNTVLGGKFKTSKISSPSHGAKLSGVFSNCSLAGTSYKSPVELSGKFDRCIIGYRLVPQSTVVSGEFSKSVFKGFGLPETLTEKARVVDSVALLSEHEEAPMGVSRYIADKTLEAERSILNSKSEVELVSSKKLSGHLTEREFEDKFLHLPVHLKPSPYYTVCESKIYPSLSLLCTIKNAFWTTLVEQETGLNMITLTDGRDEMLDEWDLTYGQEEDKEADTEINTETSVNPVPGLKTDHASSTKDVASEVSTEFKISTEGELDDTEDAPKAEPKNDSAEPFHGEAEDEDAPQLDPSLIVNIGLPRKSRIGIIEATIGRLVEPGTRPKESISELDNNNAKMYKEVTEAVVDAQLNQSKTIAQVIHEEADNRNAKMEIKVTDGDEENRSEDTRRISHAVPKSMNSLSKKEGALMTTETNPPRVVTHAEPSTGTPADKDSKEAEPATEEISINEQKTEVIPTIREVEKYENEIKKHGSKATSPTHTASRKNKGSTSKTRLGWF